MLFQNLFLMEKVGISGNADQHYSRDWLDIEIESNLDRFGEGQSTLSEDDRWCELPSVRYIEIFYKRINTEQEPQYIIMKMQHYSRVNDQWKYS